MTRFEFEGDWGGLSVRTVAMMEADGSCRALRINDSTDGAMLSWAMSQKQIVQFSAIAERLWAERHGKETGQD